MKVLVAIDGSDCAMKALDFVTQRRWDDNDRFLVLCVAEPIPAQLGLGPIPTKVTDLNENIFDECGEITTLGYATLKRALPSHSIDVKVSAGLVSETIVREANEWEADLIIMGSHGRKGFKHFLLGSIAEDVLRKADCSVEIVKGREAAESEQLAC